MSQFNMSVFTIHTKTGLFHRAGIFLIPIHQPVTSCSYNNSPFLLLFGIPPNLYFYRTFIHKQTQQVIMRKSSTEAPKACIFKNSSV